MARKSTLKPTDIDVTKVASSICAQNPQLVEWIAKTEKNYSPLRAKLTRMAPAISAKYADGSFVPAKVLHNLTWAVIDVASTSADDDISITI